MKKVFAGVLVFMVLLSLTISAEAFESKVIYRDDGMAAYASWSEYANGVYTDKFIQVLETDDGTDISVYIWTYDEKTGEWSGRSGYMFTRDDVFTMDKKLGSAILSPVNIELYDWNTDTVETITLAAQWTGEGDVMKSSSKSISKYDDFMSKYSDNSMYREATVTASINDEDLGTSDFSELIKFKSVSMYMEK
ncbi:MAG: hypothetical protein K0A89_02435 [ANME-2 cluster archaeon]|nr:hypothetical protein [ANME-2 cluster archaeon]